MLINDEPQAGKLNQIIESTFLNGFSGVSINRLSDRIETYNDEMWWLPLSDESREKASEVTPIDLCKFDIYAKEYFQDS